MESNKSILTISGIALGIVAASAGLYYLVTGKKNKPDLSKSPIQPKTLLKILQYTKYKYQPILEIVSESVRNAKENLEFNETFSNSTASSCIFVNFMLIYI